MANDFAQEPDAVQRSQRPNRTPEIEPQVSRDQMADGKDTYGLLRWALYHFHTIWLFTADDLPTTAAQAVLYGVAGASSGRLTAPGPATAVPRPGGPKAALALTVAFVWLLLLPSQMGNQSALGAPTEDAVNKPWRPISAGRIGRADAHRLVGPTLLLALAIGSALGLGPEAFIFAAMCYVYNDFGGSDAVVPRSLVNGVALAVLGQAALKLAAFPAQVNAVGYTWGVVVSLLIATTIHVMDFRDQKGDAATGRQTLPLVLGDSLARWVTVVPLLFWATLCPWLCGAGFVGYGLSAATVSVAVFRLLMYRTPSADDMTYKATTAWLAVVYTMPWLALFA